MLLIRADANTHMGTGHVMRCMALAQAWQNSGGQVSLTASSLPPALTERLRAEGITLDTIAVEPGSREDAQQTAELARSLHVQWVVVDGYQFGADYQRTLKKAGLRVLFVDDYGHAGAYCADLVLNQNSYAHEGLYADRSSQTRLLLGPQYVLLRREFWPWRGWRREIPAVACKVLVTMGGSDPDNVTLRVIQVLEQIKVPSLEATVVVGGGNPHYVELEAFAQSSHHHIRVEQNVVDMPALMAWADVAVTAGGTTCYELSLMGLPALIIVLAENQRPSAAALAAAGVGWDLGWHSLIDVPAMADALGRLRADPDARIAMMRHGQALSDGHGSVRVVAELQGGALRLRRATKADCQLLWEWSNEPVVRAASFSSEPIPWAQHVAWFAARMDDPSHHIYLAVDVGSCPVGMVRFDLTGDVATISVSLAVHARGMGYGSQLIHMGAAALFAEGRTALMHAYIKPENQASLRAFKRAGFIYAGEATIRGSRALRLVLHRKESES